MTRFFCILSVFILLADGLQAQTEDRMVSWFAFDTTVLNDKAGNGSIGTPIGDPILTCGLGNPKAQAASFDGVDDAILFIGPINDAFGSGDFSLSFFMKPSSQPGTMLVMAKQGMNCTDQPNFWVRYRSANKTMTVGLAQNDTLSATVTAGFDDDPCWQHVVIVRNQADLRLYINGVLKSTGKSTARINLTSDEILRIGEPICPTDRPYKGEIDEIRLYSKALSVAEIIGLNPRPDDIVNRDTLIYLGNSFNVGTSSSCANQWEWIDNKDILSDPFIANPVVTPTQSGVFNLELAFKHSNCVAYDRFTVTVIDPEDLDCTKVLLPNAFTPNNSPGLNDQFIISNPFAVSDFVSFQVFDRWGGVMFDAKSQFDGWDGTFKGEPVNSGQYLYRLRYFCKQQEQIINGTVILLR